MKKNTILIALAAMLVSGCSISHYAHKSPAGGDITIRQTRILWDTTGFEVQQTKDSNGVITTTLRLQKSNPNAEAIKAVAEGISEGLVKGAGKVVAPVPSL